MICQKIFKNINNRKKQTDLTEKFKLYYWFCNSIFCIILFLVDFSLFLWVRLRQYKEIRYSVTACLFLVIYQKWENLLFFAVSDSLIEINLLLFFVVSDFLIEINLLLFAVSDSLIGINLLLFFAVSDLLIEVNLLLFAVSDSLIEINLLLSFAVSDLLIKINLLLFAVSDLLIRISTTVVLLKSSSSLVS